MAQRLACHWPHQCRLPRAPLLLAPLLLLALVHDEHRGHAHAAVARLPHGSSILQQQHSVQAVQHAQKCQMQHQHQHDRQPASMNTNAGHAGPAGIVLPVANTPLDPTQHMHASRLARRLAADAASASQGTLLQSSFDPDAGSDYDDLNGHEYEYASEAPREDTAQLSAAAAVTTAAAAAAAAKPAATAIAAAEPTAVTTAAAAPATTTATAAELAARAAAAAELAARLAAAAAAAEPAATTAAAAEPAAATTTPAAKPATVIAAEAGPAEATTAAAVATTQPEASSIQPDAAASTASAAPDGSSASTSGGTGGGSGDSSSAAAGAILKEAVRPGEAEGDSLDPAGDYDTDVEDYYSVAPAALLPKGDPKAGGNAGAQEGAKEGGQDVGREGPGRASDEAAAAASAPAGGSGGGSDGSGGNIAEPQVASGGAPSSSNSAGSSQSGPGASPSASSSAPASAGATAAAAAGSGTTAVGSAVLPGRIGDGGGDGDEGSGGSGGGDDEGEASDYGNYDPSDYEGGEGALKLPAFGLRPGQGQGSAGAVQRAAVQLGAAAKAASAAAAAGGAPRTYKPRMADDQITDKGYPDLPSGWYDVQCQGVSNDFCRYVGTEEDPYWSCALAGGTQQYSARNQYLEATSFEAPCPWPIKRRMHPNVLRDLGYANQPRGWFDVQCQGAINDYCRYIGSPGDAWWSCALAGSSEQYTPRGRYSEASSSPMPCLDFSVAERHPTPPAGVPSRLDRMAALMAQRRARQAQERARAQKEEEQREAAAVEASIFGSLFGRRAQPSHLPQQQGTAARAGAGRSPWMRVSAADGATPMSIWSVSVVEVWGMLAVMAVVLLVLVALAFSGRRWWQRRGALKAGGHAGHRQGHGQVAHMPQGTGGSRGRGVI